MMETIEERWEKLGGVLRWEARVKMCRDCDGDDADLGWLDEEQAAIRDALTAVVDAIKVTEGAGYAHGMGRWECDFGAVRAQIAALKRKGEE